MSIVVGTVMRGRRSHQPGPQVGPADRVHRRRQPDSLSRRILLRGKTSTRTRKVKKDNTFSFAGGRYETPVDLRDKEIQLRYDRSRTGTAPVFIDFKGQRLGAARPLDTVANGLLRRKEQP